MPTRISNKKQSITAVAKKHIWSVKYLHKLPVTGVVRVKGKTSHGVRSFKFQVISPLQQSRERNKAYQYFTID